MRSPGDVLTCQVTGLLSSNAVRVSKDQDGGHAVIGKRSHRHGMAWERKVLCILLNVDAGE